MAKRRINQLPNAKISLSYRKSRLLISREMSKFWFVGLVQNKEQFLCMRNKNAETRITNCVMGWLQYVLFKTTRILQLWMGGVRALLQLRRWCTFLKMAGTKKLAWHPYDIMKPILPATTYSLSESRYTMNVTWDTGVIFSIIILFLLVLLVLIALTWPFFYYCY